MFALGYIKHSTWARCTEPVPSKCSSFRVCCWSWLKAKMKFPAACQGKTRPVLCWAEVLSLCGWEIKFTNFKKVSEFTWAMQAAERGCSGVWLISSRFYVCAGLLISPTDPGAAHPPTHPWLPHTCLCSSSPHMLWNGVWDPSLHPGAPDLQPRIICRTLKPSLSFQT